MKNKKMIIGIIAIVLLVGLIVVFGGNSEESVNDSTQGETTQMDNEEMQIATKNIVETAVEAGSFTTLVAAVQAAGLADVLSNGGPFTVFAPTDEAFAKLPEGTVESLLSDPEALANILTYHVVEGRVMAADVIGLSSAPTLQGSEVSIDSSNGVMINNATVIQADIETSNGIIHVIDTVLIPTS